MKIESTDGGLRVHAPAKINVFLEIAARRPDGFHDIDSLFQAVSLYDELEFTPLESGELQFEEAGIEAGTDNLVWRAADLVRRNVPAAAQKGVRIQLAKRIPAGAGLGGGSSDAAATLLALTRLWSLDVPAPSLAEWALQLGSDVPFFLVGGTARCRGQGEQIESLAEHFDAAEPLHYVLVCPHISISTGGAYESLDASRGPGFTLTGPSPLDSISPGTMRSALAQGELFFNRFESAVYGLFRPLRELHERLCSRGFVRVLLSGSGSTIYGLCRDRREAEIVSEKLSGELDDAEVYAVSSVPAWSG